MQDDKIPLELLCIDSVDVNPERFSFPFRAALPNKKIICQHRADSNFIVVGAASIIAKVERDAAIKKIEQMSGFLIGSGYPNDPVTINFLKKYFRKYNSFPEFVRQSWQTVTAIKGVK